MTATQLGLDLTPIGAFAVGDRVRVRPTAGIVLMGFLRVNAGDMGTVIAVYPPPGPADSSTWNPVSVLMDGDEPGRAYAFKHEELELVLDDAVAVDGRAA